MSNNPLGRNLSSEIEEMIRARSQELSKLKLLEKAHKDSRPKILQGQKYKNECKSQVNINRQLRHQLLESKDKVSRAEIKVEKMQRKILELEEKLESNSKMNVLLDSEISRDRLRISELEEKLAAKDKIMEGINRLHSEVHDINLKVMEKQAEEEMEIAIRQLNLKVIGMERVVEKLQEKSQNREKVPQIPEIGNLFPESTQDTGLSPSMIGYLKELKSIETQISQLFTNSIKASENEQSQFTLLISNFTDLQTNLSSTHQTLQNLQLQLTTQRSNNQQLLKKNQQLSSQNQLYEKIVTGEIKQRIETGYQQIQRKLEQISANVQVSLFSFTKKNKLNSQVPLLMSNNQLKVQIQKQGRLLNSMKKEIQGLSEETKKRERCSKCCCSFPSMKYGSLMNPQCACGAKVHMECYYESVFQCTQCCSIEESVKEQNKINQYI